VATTWRFLRSMIDTIPVGTNGVSVTRGPAEITA